MEYAIELPTPVGVGTARVVAAVAAGAADTAAVEVRQVAASLELTVPDDTLAEGEAVQLVVAVADSNGVELADPPIEWTSADAAVASVDEDGTVTGGRGDATVVVTASIDGLSADATFTVLGKIAFGSERDGNRELYVMDADGSNVVRLTDDEAIDTEGAWSPDGTKIVFVSDREGTYELYVMDADGSDVTRLTDDVPGNDVGPVWSPDGRRIAFASNRDGDFEIWVMDADGTDAVQLTDNGDYESSPSWSPDGSHIVFHSDRDGVDKIFVMSTDGSTLRRLTSGAADDFGPAWRP